MQENRQYWVGFNLVKGIGAVRLRTLLDYFGDVKTAWFADPVDLQAAGLSPKLITNLVQARETISLDQICEHILAQQIRVITWDDDFYPKLLRETSPKPPVLYVRGEILPEDDWAVAVVGTRRMTAYGRQVTEQIVAQMAHAGVTVVSGLARGIDGIAHSVALQSGGRTLAVMGSGVDVVYPPEHRRLADQILQAGALISEYLPGTKPEASNFPPRNRIISGLSLATVVVEADKRSGALITANFSVEQGREVFAVPGNINAPQSRGANRLIRDGAHPLLDPQDILAVLDLNLISEQRAARIVLPANALEAQLYEILSVEPLHIDEIRAQSNLPIADVSSTLAMMELKGMIRQVGGMRYTALKEVQAEYRVDEKKGS